MWFNHAYHSQSTDMSMLIMIVLPKVMPAIPSSRFKTLSLSRIRLIAIQRMYRCPLTVLEVAFGSTMELTLQDFSKGQLGNRAPRRNQLLEQGLQPSVAC